MDVAQEVENPASEMYSEVSVSYTRRRRDKRFRCLKKNSPPMKYADCLVLINGKHDVKEGSGKNTLVATSAHFGSRHISCDPNQGNTSLPQVTIVHHLPFEFSI